MGSCAPAAYPEFVFPLLSAVDAGLLLSHSYRLETLKTGLPLWRSHTYRSDAAWDGSRWPELRLPPPDTSALSWVWSLALVLIGVPLLLDRES